jgi:hypothetical protein
MVYPQLMTIKTIVDYYMYEYVPEKYMDIFWFCLVVSMADLITTFIGLIHGFKDYNFIVMKIWSYGIVIFLTGLWILKMISLTPLYNIQKFNIWHDIKDNYFKLILINIYVATHVILLLVVVFNIKTLITGW